MNRLGDHSRNSMLRLVLCLLPLATTPLWGYLIAEDFLSFGGGKKDLIWLIPWLVWAILYAIIFAICWMKRLPLKRALGYAGGGAAGMVVLAWLGLLFWSMGWLGGG